jgi:C4-dicarboxylate transporter DctQ subunit
MGARINMMFDHVFIGLAYFSAGLLAFVLVTVCADVIGRYIFNQPLGWVVQISGYILLYITFLPLAWVLKEEEHVIVDTVLRQLPPKAQALLNFVTSILGALAFLLVTWFGVSVTWDLYRRSVPIMDYIWFPEYLVVTAIPIGSFLFSIEFARRACRFLSKLRTLER